MGQVKDHKKFLDGLRHEEIVAAIKAAEHGTSGEIRVFVTHRRPEDVVASAQKEFNRLGMAQTHHRNGVLLYVAPVSRQFAIIGDAGVHQHCGDDFWREVAGEMTRYFKQGDFTAGLVHGIGRAGQLLAAHFPPCPDDGNELPDEVAHD